MTSEDVSEFARLNNRAAKPGLSAAFTGTELAHEMRAAPKRAPHLASFCLDEETHRMLRNGVRDLNDHAQDAGRPGVPYSMSGVITDLVHYLFDRDYDQWYARRVAEGKAVNIADWRERRD